MQPFFLLARMVVAADGKPAPRHAEAALVAAVAAELCLLRPPQRGRGEVLVDPRLEEDIGALQGLACPPELHVEAAERGATVAGDVAGGALADPRVAGRLHQGQADDRLRAGDQAPVSGRVEFVLAGYRPHTHSH